MMKKINKKIWIGIFVVIILVASGWWIWNSKNSFTEVDDKLKDKLGQEVTFTGTALFLKGFFIQIENKDYYCLIIEDSTLEEKYFQYHQKNITVKGTVEKKMTDYGECTGLKQKCGKWLQYCIKVEEIIPIE